MKIKYRHIRTEEIITVVKFKAMYCKYKDALNQTKHMSLSILDESYKK